MRKFKNPLASTKCYILVLLGLAMVFLLLGAGWAVCLCFYGCFLLKLWAVVGILWFLAIILIKEAFDEWRKTKAPADK